MPLPFEIDQTIENLEEGIWSTDRVEQLKIAALLAIAAALQAIAVATQEQAD